MKKWYRVAWKQVIPGESFVEARSEKEAREKAMRGKDSGFDLFEEYANLQIEDVELVGN